MLSFTLSFNFAIAAESTKYDFDSVKVEYAATFSATPFNVSPDNWVSKIASGDKDLSVVFGVIRLQTNGFTNFDEEFIKIQGEGGSERFLLNGASYEYYPDETTVSTGATPIEDTVKTIPGSIKKISSFFWSAKKLVGNSVIKDKTLPIKSVTLVRQFKDNQLTSIILYFNNDGEAASEYLASTQTLTENIYNMDITSLNQSGDATAR